MKVILNNSMTNNKECLFTENDLLIISKNFNETLLLFDFNQFQLTLVDFVLSKNRFLEVS
jgi:hypothetical protein